MIEPRHITVLLGGPSAEREVSLRSGRAVAEALRSLGHHVTEVDPQNEDWTLPEPTDVVFLALHGTYGEDGAVQERLETLDVPYTGCDPQASRIAFDKLLTKNACKQNGVPTLPCLVIEDPHQPWPKDWKPPVILKPARQGSSVGLGFIESTDQWPAALAEAFRYDTKAFIEPLIRGREVTVGILDDAALPPIEVRPKGGRYDYVHKYTPGGAEYLCPAPFDEHMRHRLQETALQAFRAIGGRDYARVDLMVAPDGTPYVLEVNTLPGMTETSLFPKAAAAIGLDYAQLCQRMIELALRRSRSSAPSA